MKESPAPKNNEAEFDFMEETSKIKFDKLDPNEVFGSYKKPQDGDQDLLMQDEVKMKDELSGLQSDQDSSYKESKNSNEEKEDEICEILEFIKPIKPIGLLDDQLEETNYENLFIEQSKIVNIDIIGLRAYFGYYQKIQTVYEDVMYLLKYTLSNRCKTQCSKYYLSELIFYCHNLFKDKERIKTFKKLYKEDLDFKFSINYGLKVQGKWNKVIGSQRQYIPVDEYKPVVDDVDTLMRLKTSKTRVCQGGCCDQFDKLGPLTYTEEYWESNCPCRRAKVE